MSDMPPIQLPEQPQPVPAPPKEAGFGELFGIAARQNFISEAASSSEQLLTAGDPVEGYKPSMEEVQSLTKGMGLTEAQSKVLSGALSPDELQYRAKAMSDTNASRKQLDDAGWTGTAAEVLSYVADPAMLGTYAIKTPLVVGKVLARVGIKASQSAIMGGVERAVGAGIIGGGLGLGQEAALAQYDPNRDVDDVILAGLSGVVGGMAFSGLVDGGAAILNKATRNRQIGRELLDSVEHTDHWNDNLSMINNADNEVTNASLFRIETTSYGKLFNMLEGEVPDALARKRVLTEGDAINRLIGELEPTAAQRMSRGDREIMTADIRDANFKARTATEAADNLRSSPLTGSGKALATSRQGLSAQLAELQRTIGGETERAAVLQARLDPHVNGEFAQATGDISRLQNGIIPDRLQQRYLDLITPDDAAPAFEEARRILPERAEPTVVPEEARAESLATKLDGTKEGEPAPVASKSDTSVSAAETRDAIIFPDEEGKELNEAMNSVLSGLHDVGSRIPFSKKAGTTALYTRAMADVKDNSIRGLGALVFNDPHGVKGGPQSAIAFADSQRTRIMPKAFFVEDAARTEFIKAQGINPLLEAGKANQASVSFDRQVVLAIRDFGNGTVPPIAATDSTVVRAAKARAGAYQEALEMMKRYGVRGFEEVEARGDYSPVLMGKNDITTALDKYGEDSVKEVMMKAYMSGEVKLSQKSAKAVADATLERYYRKSGAVAVAKPSQSISGKIADVVNELRAGGVDDNEIKTVIRMLQDKADDDSISARAMDSLRPNVNATSLDGLRFVDLMDASQASVDKYVRDAAGQSAFARYGMKSRRQVEDTINESFTRHRKEIADMANHLAESKQRLARIDRSNPELADSVSRLETDIRNIERLGDLNEYRKTLDSYEPDFYNGIKATFGEPIEEANALNHVIGGTGKLVNLMLLGFSGMAQVADLGIIFARAGVGATLRNLPISLVHGVRSTLPSAEYFTRNTELNNMAEIFGSFSHQDYLFGHKMMNGAEYGDAVIGHVSKADKTLDRIGWTQGAMSLLRPVQGLIDELSARSLLTNIVQLSKGGMFTGSTRKQLLEVGKMSEESLEAALTHINSRMNQGDTIFQAVKVMPPKLRDELGTGLRTVHSSNITRSYYGELPAWTNTSLGKGMLKLQSFALVAYEKAIQRGIRHDKAGLIAATAFSAGLAYMWAEVDVRVASLKVPEEKRDEYVQKRLEDQLAYTVAGRMSQVAMFSNAAQLYNLANPYEDSVLKPFGEYRGVASAGAIGKVGQAAKAGANLLTDQSVDPEADKYKVYGAIPLLNTAMGMAILNTL